MIVTAHTNRGILSEMYPADRIFRAVEMKLMAPRIDEIPARWREKIAKSTEGPEWARFLDKGGYTVHPVPTPDSIMAEETRRISAGGRSQNLMLFIRGKAISGAESIKGTNQFPNPPIKTGITRKKIIKKA